MPLLPPDVLSLARRLADEFARRGFEAYLVGGIVRDALLGGGISDDLDVATNAAPSETRRALKAAGADAVYDVGERFGTIASVFGPLRVEVTTYRAEAYQAGSRKPEVSFHGALEADLARRDLTVNAMALDPRTGAVEDPFGGRSDLERGIIRAVGEPAERFQEDPLRLLRAVRFAARLGFDVEERTAAAMLAQADALSTISRERVRDELNKLLTSPSPGRGVFLLCELGPAAQTLPELLAMRGMSQEAGRHKDVFTHTLQVLERTPPRPSVRWAALLHDIAKPRTRTIGSRGDVHFFGHDTRGERMTRHILAELRQPQEVIERVGRLVGLHLRANAYETDWTDGAVRRFVREVGDDLLEDLLALSRADVTSARADRRLAIARSVTELEHRIADLRAQADIARLASPLDGNDLMELFQCPPGPWIKPIKERLLELVLDGELAPDDREAAIPIARQLFEDTQLMTGRPALQTSASRPSP